MMPMIAPPAQSTVPAGWKAPPFPPAKVLEGQYCRLEPLDVSGHIDDIWACDVGRDDVWDWLPAAPPKSKDEYRALLDALPLDDAGRATAVAEAQEAFRLNRALFAELGQLHPAA